MGSKKITKTSKMGCSERTNHLSTATAEITLQMFRCGKNDGTVTGLKVDTIANLGGYAS